MWSRLVNSCKARWSPSARTKICSWKLRKKSSRTKVSYNRSDQSFNPKVSWVYKKDFRQHWLSSSAWIVSDSGHTRPSTISVGTGGRTENILQYFRYSGAGWVEFLDQQLAVLCIWSKHKSKRSLMAHMQLDFSTAIITQSVHSAEFWGRTESEVRLEPSILNKRVNWVFEQVFGEVGLEFS